MPDSDKNRCFICLENSPSLIQSGCACRGDAGRAHPDCRVKAAQALVKRKDWRWWFTCQTCEQEFTGAMCIALTNAWWSQVRDRAEEDPERLAAAHNMANSFSQQAKHAEAEEMLREVLAVRKQVLGAEHPDTLAAAGNLAISVSGQGKQAEAEEMEREVLPVLKQVLGAEHPDTLAAAHNLAISLVHQGKHAEAEEMQREVLAVLKRVQGAEHPDTLTTESHLARSLYSQGKHAEVEEIQREVLACRKRAVEGSGACADGCKRRK